MFGVRLSTSLSVGFTAASRSANDSRFFCSFDLREEGSSLLFSTRVNSPQISCGFCFRVVDAVIWCIHIYILKSLYNV